MKYFDREIFLRSTNLSEKFNYNTYLEKNGKDNVTPLFLIDKNKNLEVFTHDTKPKPEAGDMLISLVKK
jgi:hypothetical protein